MKKRFALLLAAMPLMVPQVGADVLVQPTASTARDMKSAPLFNGTLVKPARKAGAHRAIASRGDSGLDITVKGFGETTALWSEDFNGGSLPQGWQIDGSTDIEWGVKVIAADGNKSYSQFDPDDAGSLYVSGPYQTYKRAIASATSPEISVGKNCTLDLAVGFSLNFDDECRLAISASTDGFETSTQLWRSDEAQGDRPWQWRMVSLPLDEFAGKTIRLRFTYGPGGKDQFGTGGYSGDFAIDGLKISGPSTVESVSVMTGEPLTFVASGAPEGCGYEWSFPGGVPATSTEASPEVYYTADGVYDVSLQLTGADGAVTRTGFVKVTGFAPVARIGLPATFNEWQTRLPLVAPMAEVTFTDASEGFPTSHEWVFTGIGTEGTETVTLSGDRQTVRYNFLHQQLAGLTVANQHGTSDAIADLTVEYDGIITNFKANDVATVFDLDGESSFPGSNKYGITAYAERFSAPSVPLKVFGAAVYFVRNDAEEVVDQIANVGVHLYTSENGLPGKRLDSMWWSVFELDMPGASGLVGTEFPFTEAPVVTDEFFVVIDGIPARNETCNVQFAMADFRGEGNTALFMRDGKWVEASDYFPAGANHTSYLVALDVAHSVIESLPAGRRSIEVGAGAGTVDFDIFSFFGWKADAVDIDAPWCRIESVPNDMTVDCITIAYDAMPASAGETREAHITFTDGMSTLPLTVVQSRTSGLTLTAADTSAPAIAYDRASARLTAPGASATPIEVTDLAGRLLLRGAGTLDVATLPAGLYIARTSSAALKFTR